MDSENTFILIFSAPEYIDNREPLNQLIKHYPISKISGEVQGYFYSKTLSSIDLESYLRDPSHIKEMIKLSS